MATTENKSLKFRISAILQNAPKPRQNFREISDDRDITIKSTKDLIKSVIIQPVQPKKRLEMNIKEIRLKTVYLLRKLQYSRISLQEFHRNNLFPKEPYHFGIEGRMFLHRVKTNKITEMSRMLVENPFLVHDFDTVSDD